MTETELKIAKMQTQGFTPFQMAEELKMEVVSVTNRINEIKRGGRTADVERRSLMPRRSVFFDITAANKFRATLDMAPVRCGKRECLGCERIFMSDDLKNQKMCNYCRGNV
jgi:hypothetical protein